ncbi:hypothetical protein P170DRAFT_508091 [Aspergillus steynii IBT 23096]|uniref:AAA+ ATPase domain-containing protein n=1 Tax=Aspergillus steynii IBT 23096 TaxID=1392250 RepID=A0A2I2GKS4_9EURO|nr:uncharacterized protein P170DRAFT_508091 [Aspergillus steynii IBT 23096]PLB53481.1 hypothetical protein P170DRAFT_508091 [Aspergillus steynii IBT 23096]
MERMESPGREVKSEAADQDAFHIKLMAPPVGTIGEEFDEAKKKAWEENRQKMALKAVVEYLDYSHFKNRFAEDEGLAVIEVLLGHHTLAQQIWQESNQRHMQGWGIRINRVPSRTKEDGDTWIQRVRVQSPQLLLLLSRLTGHQEQWANAGARVFYRPFLSFHYYLPQMKKCLEILEKNWSAADKMEGSNLAIPSNVTPRAQDRRGDAKDESSHASDEFRPMTPEESVVGPIADSVTALRHVRTYVQFMETEITPLWERAAGTTQRKVSFLDLWMFFQPGELIYVPSLSESSSGQIWPGPANISQKVWRLHTIGRDSFSEYTAQCDIPSKSSQELDLWCYFIDFNGVSYEPFVERFSIRSYEGLRDITTLKVYPLRFFKDKDKVLDAQRKQGQEFQKALDQKYLYYEGWTLAFEPTDHQRLSEGGNTEHIDSPVMIDFVEAHKSDEGLASKSNFTLGWSEGSWSAKEDPMAIRHWDDSGYHVLGEFTETRQLEERFEETFSKYDLEHNTFLRESREGSVTQVGDDDLVLLPRRVVGYTFHERRFVRFDTRWLRPISKTENVFKDLRIDESHKRMVRALVKTHFQRQRLNLDLIRGKGSGLVILLHGVPGVGKTATAEAVAQANNKPLFAITCGDLGFTPESVDTHLKEIFRLAHRWGCVLLLDEADVFLTRRDISDLNRNALVSVFLRVLEYYSGILFLTTNRVGILDEAFKSRIHLTLHYRNLSRDQTLGIFETNIRRLRRAEEDKRKRLAADPDLPPAPTLRIDDISILDYAAWHYDNNEDHRWNGRQIRNAFQVAYSFAQFDMQSGALDAWDENAEENDEETTPSPEEDKPVPSVNVNHVMDYQQFELIANTIRRFDNYLFETIGETESEQAFNYSLRADYHDPDELDDGLVYTPQPPSQRARRGRQYNYPPRGSSRGRGQARGGPSRGGNGMPRPARQNLPREASPTPAYKPPSKDVIGQQQARMAPPRGRGPQGTPRSSASPRSAAPRARGTGAPRRPPGQRSAGYQPGYADSGSRDMERSDYDDYLDAEGYEDEAYEGYDLAEDDQDDYDNGYYGH